ncbi:MAG: hypothetical protein KDJ15_07180, partial [Alphaproteobacteria bacterium]|nr:hypothetical protein [Alphaproteobacteria bacterium]
FDNITQSVLDSAASVTPASNTEYAVTANMALLNVSSQDGTTFTVTSAGLGDCEVLAAVIDERTGQVSLMDLVGEPTDADHALSFERRGEPYIKFLHTAGNGQEGAFALTRTHSLTLQPGQRVVFLAGSDGLLARDRALAEPGLDALLDAKRQIGEFLAKELQEQGVDNVDIAAALRDRALSIDPAGADNVTVSAMTVRPGEKINGITLGTIDASGVKSPILDVVEETLRETIPGYVPIAQPTGANLKPLAAYTQAKPSQIDFPVKARGAANMAAEGVENAAKLGKMKILGKVLGHIGHKFPAIGGAIGAGSAALVASEAQAAFDRGELTKKQFYAIAAAAPVIAASGVADPVTGMIAEEAVDKALAAEGIPEEYRFGTLTDSIAELGEAFKDDLVNSEYAVEGSARHGRNRVQTYLARTSAAQEHGLVGNTQTPVADQAGLKGAFTLRADPDVRPPLVSPDTPGPEGPASRMRPAAPMIPA